MVTKKLAKLKLTFLIGCVAGVLFLLLVFATMCSNNALMSGNDLQLLGHICFDNVENDLLQIKGETTEEGEEGWQVVVGESLSAQALASNSLPSRYYKKIKVHLNSNYANSQRTINEVGLYVTAEKDITFTLRLSYGEKNGTLKTLDQTLSLVAGQGQAVMFCIYESMQNIDCLQFSNETEIKGIDDIVKWTMKDVKVSFNE